MVPPIHPIVTEVTPASNSVVITWLVVTIAFDQENYTVQYGRDMAVLQSSDVIMGNTDFSAINDTFSVTITGVIPFTTYYYVLIATNSIGSTSSNITTFTTSEAGML